MRSWSVWSRFEWHRRRCHSSLCGTDDVHHGRHSARPALTARSRKGGSLLETAVYGVWPVTKSQTHRDNAPTCREESIPCSNLGS
eukprot:gene13722-biopygen2020